MSTFEQKEYFDRDQASAEKWGDGPWSKEPDKIHWVDEKTGLDCLIHRHPSSGHLCGYVGVAVGHPAFEKEYDAVPVEVHGGLTYADFCQEDTECESRGICHVPFAGRPEKVWWLGFDCAHAGDFSPISNVFKSEAWFSRKYETYKDVEYVKQETARLAAQLAEMEFDDELPQ